MIRWITLTTLWVLFLLHAGVASSIITAEISVDDNQRTGPPPLFVHFSAVGQNSNHTLAGTDDSNITTESEEWNELVYHWNFDDSDSGTWAYGVRKGSKNEDFKPITGHVFMEESSYPTTHNVTLTVWNPATGETDTASVVITVTDPSDTWTDANTYCFRDGAPDSYLGCPLDTDSDGTCDVQAGNCQLATSFSDAVKNVCDMDSTSANVPIRCLFRRGDTFNGDSNIVLRNSYGYIDAFGSGADPIINKSSVILFSPQDYAGGQIRGWRIANLLIQGDGAGFNTGVFYWASFLGGGATPGYWRESLIYDVEMRDIDGSCILQQTDTAAVARLEADLYNDAQHHHSGYIDTDCINMVDHAGAHNVIFGLFPHSFIAGGKYGPNDGHEHILRSPKLNRTAIAHNEFGYGTGDIRTVFKITSENDSNLDQTKCNSQWAIHDNVIGGDGVSGSASIIDIHHQDGASSSGWQKACSLDWLFEENFVDYNVGRSCCTQAVYASYGLGTIRNNLWDLTNPSSPPALRVNDHCTFTPPGFCPQPTNHDYLPDGIIVENNSVFDAGANTAAPFQFEEPVTNPAIARNNIGHFVTGAPASFISGTAGAVTQSENYMEGNNPYSVATPTEPADFALASYTRFAPASAGIDIQGNCRNVSNSAVGAYEDPANAITCPWDGGGGQIPLQEPDPTLGHSTSAVGINLNRVKPENPGVPFINVFKKAQRWFEDTAGGCDHANAIDISLANLDTNQYPNAGVNDVDCVYTTVFPIDYADSFWPTGDYTLYYDGTAAVTLSGSIVSGTYCGDNDCDSGETFTLGTGDGPLYIDVAAPDRITNARLYPPGGVCAKNSSPAASEILPWAFCDTSSCPSGNCDDTVTCSQVEGGEYPQCVSLATVGESGALNFHPLFVSRLSEYRGIRFMDWNGVNRSFMSTFNGLADPNHFTFQFDRNNGGAVDVPPEYIAELCNLLAPVECWVSIPIHLGDDDTEATALFDFYAANTDEDVTMIFELSNEVWNGGFSQGRQAAALAAGRSSTEFDGRGCCTYHFTSQTPAAVQWNCDPVADDGLVGTGTRAAMIAYATPQTGDQWHMTDADSRNLSGCPGGDCCANADGGGGGENMICEYGAGGWAFRVDIGQCADSYYGMRTYQLGALMETSFGASAGRARMMMARQAASVEPTRRAFNCDNHANGLDVVGTPDDCYSQFASSGVDMYSIAVYFGDYDNCESVTGVDDNAKMASLCSTLDAQAATSFDQPGWFSNHDAVINDPTPSPPTSFNLGLGIGMYEGGHEQWPDAGNTPPNTFDDQICMTLMRDATSCIDNTIYSSLDEFIGLADGTKNTLPIEAFYQFNFMGRYYIDNAFYKGNNYGVRGSMHHTWPKESGMLEWIRDNPCWWSGCELTPAQVESIRGLTGGSNEGGKME